MPRLKLFLAIIFLFFSASQCFAITLLIKEEALERLFPDADEITEQKITASSKQINAIKQALGGKLVHTLKGTEAYELDAQKEFIFYFGKKTGKVIGVALILKEPGKWGLIKFIVRMSPEPAIEAVAVMEYKETRGRPIAAQSLLKQFVGKSLNAPFALGRNIQAISGATVSSEAACFTVKKALILYKELVINK